MLESLKKLFGFGPKVNYAELVQQGAVILDVRSKGEYQSGHIKGSINISVDTLNNNLSKLKKDKTIITCCASGMRISAAKNNLKSKSEFEINKDSLDVKKEKIEKLKELMPEVFTESNKLDVDKLKKTLSEFVNDENERYVLNWAGKNESFKVLQTQTTATLAPDKEESINFDTTENIFIEGENLEVLKVLQKSYHNKIKMIYIDPPYNTGNDSFIYPDKLE